MKKVILVTGGSSGIGKAICEHLQAVGFNVFGTSRNPDRYHDHPFPLLELDVTNQDSVANCVNTIVEKSGQLDVLINNAGAGITGPLEEIPTEAIRQNFETNFIGPVQMIQAVLPVMREQGSGQIINITSLAAYIGLPFRGVYSSSKAALEILTEAIRIEVKDFNISVTNLAPGDYATNIAAGRYHAPLLEDSPYALTYGRMLRSIDDDVDGGNDPKEVALAIENLISKSNPKPHHKVGPFMQKLSPIIKAFLPQKTFEKILLKHLKL